MDPEIEKLIKEQMEKLTPELRELFTDPSVGEKLINIGNRNSLNVEQLGILQTETYLVMLGLVHPDDYVHELKNSLKIDNLKTSIIASDVNKEIFFAIREKLKETYNKTGEERSGGGMIEEKIPRPEQNNKELEKTGVEIVPDAAPADNNNHIETREEILARLEKPELGAPARNVSSVADARPHDSQQRVGQAGGPHPIVAQKLSGPMKIPSVKTEHTLKNLTKPSETTQVPEPQKPPTPPKYDIDPYREVPE